MFTRLENTALYAESKRKSAERKAPEVIPHATLDHIFSLLSSLIGSEILTSYLYHEAVSVGRKLQRVRGVAGVAGLGYPFYSTDRFGNPIDVPEIQNFIEQVRAAISRDAEQNPEGWRVPDCEHNLSDPCSECKESLLTARQLSKGVLDLDMIAIVDRPNEQTEVDIQTMLGGMGYKQSDLSIGEALLNTKSNLESLSRGEYPEEKIPIDVHIWSKQEVMRCLDQVASGATDVSIIGRALHAGWVDHRINFWFDFVFSFTEVTQFDSDLAQKIAHTRSKIKETYSIDQIKEIVKNSSPRAARLMESTEVQRVLEERVASW